MDREAFRQEGSDAPVQLDHPRYGRSSAQVCEAPDQLLLVRRGERVPACSRLYHVWMEANQPLLMLGVGWGRHFGAGRLVAVEDE